MTRYGTHLARPRSRLRRLLPVLFFLAGFGIWLHAQETEPESEAAETQPVPAEDSAVTEAGDVGVSDVAEEQGADGVESDEDEAESSDAGVSTGGGTVTLLQIQGAIGPATADFITRGIEMAEESNATLIVLEMDTPGGLDTSMREIIQGILASSVPVATYVWPQGARAASAGTYILYASHIAAMAPATNLGAATPVAIGAPAPASPTDTADEEADGDETDSDQDASGEDEDGGDSDGADADDGDADDSDTGDSGTDGGEDTGTGPSDLIPAPATATERKAINDAVAYIRSLAELRGRNADWAEDAVRAAESLSSQDALEMNVIDLVADDLSDLLQKLDGWEVEINGRSFELDTTGLIYERIEPDWRTRLLEVISNPTVAYMLMLLGIYGLIFEGYNPGAIVPGVVGAISLLLALFAFQVLPINYAGLALIALGVILMVSEFLVPSFGALGMGGIAAFIFGSVILIDSDIPGFGVSLPLIITIAASGALVLLGIVWFAVRSRDRPVVSGQEEMVGANAEALHDFDTRGQIWVHGERWTARTSTPVSAGQSLEVVRVDGLTLHVKPKDSA
ncbi:MAG: nodulation protein NfeD [Rhodospirillaceae bacterium]|nr:nodulation protein NfeD [Rhodospirillaceae bacterium]